MEPGTVEHVVYREAQHAFECLACFELVEVRPNVIANAERFLQTREMVELDHQECPSYGSVQEARNARRYRKEKKRRELVAQKVFESNPRRQQGCR